MSVTVTREFVKAGRWEVRVRGRLHSAWMREEHARTMRAMLVAEPHAHPWLAHGDVGSIAKIRRGA